VTAIFRDDEFNMIDPRQFRFAACRDKTRFSLGEKSEWGSTGGHPPRGVFARLVEPFIRGG